MRAMPPWTLWLIWLVLGYFVGSIPFGVWLARAKQVELRQHGSGNVGATNVGRVLGRAWGIGCFMLDMGKGLVPVLGYGLATGAIGAGTAGVWLMLGWLTVAAAAVVGHMCSPWLGFTGGKGVATGLGAVLGLYPVLTVAGIAAALVWGLAVWLTGYVSIASMTAALALPPLGVVTGLIFGASPGEIAVITVLTLVLAGLVIWRHRSNITRLRAGTEEKITWTGR